MAAALADQRSRRLMAKQQGNEMALRIHTDDLPAINMLISDIQALESRAARLRMFLTMHALNEAKNKAGWELAEQLEAVTASLPIVSTA